MGVTDTTVRVTHSFGVVTQTEVANVISLQDPSPFIRCCINCSADAEPWGQLEMGGWPRVLRGGLAPLTVASWRGCGWSGGGVCRRCSCQERSRARGLGSECPWEGNYVRTEVAGGKVLPEPLEV